MSRATGMSAVCLFNKWLTASAYIVMVPPFRFSLFENMFNNASIVAMEGPGMKSFQGQAAAPSWNREESQTCLNSVKKLIDNIDCCQLKASSIIWMVTILRIILSMYDDMTELMTSNLSKPHTMRERQTFCPCSRLTTRNPAMSKQVLSRQSRSWDDRLPSSFGDPIANDGGWLFKDEVPV